jgi:rhodanese-related sulfurtransferase/signal-transduction protein with cAMP-binding, CBS, and nucleotidyltransferase domain
MGKPLELISQATLNRFYPLSAIDASYLEELNQTALFATFSTGELISKEGKGSRLRHFLLEGEIELRHSFDHRQSIVPGEPESKRALEESIQAGGSIKAGKACKVLILNHQVIENLLEKSNQFDYEILHSSELDQALDHAPIDDEYQEDWTNRFIRSALAQNLSATNMHNLFTELRSYKVQNNEDIVHFNSEADYFYILKKGYAVVKTDTNGAHKGQHIELFPGDYFGDEALVADTCRNATVTMTSDGEIAMLEREAFERIVKSAVVKACPFELMTQTGINERHLIDVRMPIECQSSPHPQSENIPISRLRMHLDSFDVSKIYLITPEGGVRSELATYLMRQAGLEAYCMM